jgi:hypothetical protein
LKQNHNGFYYGYYHYSNLTPFNKTIYPVGQFNRNGCANGHFNKRAFFIFGEVNDLDMEENPRSRSPADVVMTHKFL